MLDISGRVWVDDHIRQPKSPRNGLSPGASSSLNSSSLLPTGSGTFLSCFTSIRPQTIQTFAGNWSTVPSSKPCHKSTRNTTVAHRGFHRRRIIQIPPELVTPCPLSYSKHIINMYYYSLHYNPLLHQTKTGCLRLVHRKNPLTNKHLV